ncbi:glycosyltransferase family 25 protein [Ciceribacter sp. L1K22]|uniref:glycosyltransferase family 25 protein n=1 Tax=Ciceribacter sp. L1K22 TaxID=2820275 RepID=UPI001ABE302E|nr:glycosyltransferase family 25 protein [Ciceribacter sp. L1K22]MBO3761222.1 glycosyltransferase family 25 protein [Ciceribacter sp. L1K22]
MAIYLINMDRDTDRLEHMTRQLDGLAFERLPAFDGRRLTDEELAVIRAERPGASWSRGQVGCFFSHVEAWAKIAAGDDPYGVVLEDDLHLSGDFGKFAALYTIAGFPTDADIVRLESTTNSVLLGPSTLDADGRSLRRIRSSTWCTGAYLLSKSAAAKLLALDKSTHTVADYFLFCYEASPVPELLNIYQLTPAVAIQDKFANPETTTFTTTIDTGPGDVERLTPSVLLRKIMRFLRGYRRVTAR